MNHEEQDDLWELLGKARAPKERPFFAAKVLRAIQEDSSREPVGFAASGFAAIWHAIRRRWAMFLATSAAVIVAGVFAFGPHTPPVVRIPETPKSPTDPLAALVAVSDSSDDLVSSLDGLMATQDNSIWLADSSPY